MAELKPFKAIRPKSGKVVHVASRSYEDYSPEELEAQLNFNPFSFLHIINPGYKFQKEISGTQRFNLVRNRYLEFLEGNIFKKDKENSFYVYRLQKEEHSFCGIFAGTSVNDYNTNVIKKHEATLSHREELFKEYLKIVGFNAEPVLMTYKNNTEISTIISDVCKTRPEYHFSSTDRVKHTLWRISESKVITQLTAAFSKIDNLYIADGHHRSASSSLLAKDYKDQNPEVRSQVASDYFMSYLIPESEIKIYEFNRMVKDLNGLSKEQFLMLLDEKFRIENKGQELYKPSKKHHFSMYLDGEFYSLYLRKTNHEFTDALSKLDTQILYETILAPILGINDLRNDSRIKYGFDKDSVIKMKMLIDRNEFVVAFNSVPVTIEEIKSIADEGLVMPPKSTYIEPKLRSGLTIYELS